MYRTRCTSVGTKVAALATVATLSFVGAACSSDDDSPDDDAPSEPVGTDAPDDGGGALDGSTPEADTGGD